MSTKTIGQRIAEVRAARRISQSELARRLEIKPQAVQKWEGGGNPRTQRISDIAAALGVSTSELVAGTDLGTEVSPAAGSWPFTADRRDFNKLRSADARDLDQTVTGFIAVTLARYRKEEVAGNKPPVQRNEMRASRSTMESLDRAVEDAKGVASGSTSHGRAAATHKRGSGSR